MANINQINELIDAVGNSERITKQALTELSRTILEYVVVNDGVEGNNKGSEDSQVVNRLLAALTPVNKKVGMSFFRHFLAFHFDEEGMKFGSKNKKQWDKKEELVKEFLGEPHNNIWTWADRNIEIIPKPMDDKKLNAAIGQIVKKATKAGLGHGNIIKALIVNGVDAGEIITILNAMGEEANA